MPHLLQPCEQPLADADGDIEFTLTSDIPLFASLCTAVAAFLVGSAEAFSGVSVLSQSRVAARAANTQMYAVTLVTPDGTSEIDCADDVYVLDKAEEDGIVRRLPSEAAPHNMRAPRSLCTTLTPHPALYLWYLGRDLLRRCQLTFSLFSTAGPAVLVPRRRLLHLRGHRHRWLH